MTLSREREREYIRVRLFRFSFLFRVITASQLLRSLNYKTTLYSSYKHMPKRLTGNFLFKNKKFVWVCFIFNHHCLLDIIFFYFTYIIYLCHYSLIIIHSQFKIHTSKFGSNCNFII